MAHRCWTGDDRHGATLLGLDVVAALGGVLAEVTHRATGDRGGDHVELRIGDAAVMVGGGTGSVDQDVPASFVLYVDDVDGLYDRALEAGAAA